MFVLAIIMVITKYLSDDGFNFFEFHVHVNELAAVRAAVMIMSYFGWVTWLIFISLFLNLLDAGIFLVDLVKVLIIITLIVNSVCPRVLIHFFIDLSLIKAKI